MPFKVYCMSEVKTMPWNKKNFPDRALPQHKSMEEDFRKDTKVHEVPRSTVGSITKEISSHPKPVFLELKLNSWTQWALKIVTKNRWSRRSTALSQSGLYESGQKLKLVLSKIHKRAIHPRVCQITLKSFWKHEGNDSLLWWDKNWTPWPEYQLL